MVDNNDDIENLSNEEILKYFDDILEVPDNLSDACYSGPQHCIYSGTAK